MEIMEMNEQLENAANLQAIQDIETGIKCEILFYIIILVHRIHRGHQAITYLYGYFYQNRQDYTIHRGGIISFWG